MAVIKLSAKAQEMLDRMNKLASNKIEKTVAYDDTFDIISASDKSINIDGTIHSTYIEEDDNGKEVVYNNSIDRIGVFDKDMEVLRGLVGANNLKLSHLSGVQGIKVRVRTRMYVDKKGREVFDHVLNFVIGDKHLVSLKKLADNDTSQTVNNNQSVLLP